MKITFGLQLATFGYAMLLLWIFSMLDVVALGSFKYLAFLVGIFLFPTGLQLIKKNLELKKSKQRKAHSQV